MARFAVGDVIDVIMPKGYSKRGVLGVSVMYTTSMEARFEGARGTVVEVNPQGTHGVPQYLVDFTPHDNSKLGLPTRSSWIREEWLDRPR